MCSKTVGAYELTQIQMTNKFRKKRNESVISIGISIRTEWTNQMYGT